MGTLLDDTPLAQHQDLVGIDHLYTVSTQQAHSEHTVSTQ